MTKATQRKTAGSSSPGQFELDGHPAECNGTILESCTQAGVHVAAFCARPGLSHGGHCRSCIVEVDGRPTAACTTEAAPGSVVVTESNRLRKYRRQLGELMLLEAQPKGEVERTLKSWGVEGVRPEAASVDRRTDDSHPYLRLALDRCIKCRLCEKACDEIQGQFVFSFEGRGVDTTLLWGDSDFASTDCVSCGACVEACPTEAITDVDRAERSEGPRSPDLSITRTTCGYCGVGCQLQVEVADGRVQRISGTATAAVNRGHLCVKGRYAHGFSRHPDRITEPLIRRDGRLVPASWEEAISTVAKGLLQARGQVGALSSSRCTNEENYLVQKWLRAGLGTHNVDCCARVCHAPTAAGMKQVFGTGAATNSISDIDAADAILVAGANATEAHPIVGARIKQAVFRGAKLVVIDPRRTELAELADVHLQLTAGSNIALLNALAKVIVEEGLVDREFILDRTDGFAEYTNFLINGPSLEDWSAACGVPQDAIRAAARVYATAPKPLQVHGLGMTEHYQGSESVMLLCNLALLVGGLGREGVGVNPLRGQNNVQGAADMGCQPDSLTGYLDWNDAQVRERIHQLWGGQLPTEPGLTLPRMYEAALAGRLTALYILGEDVLQSDPSVHAKEAIDKLDFLVVQELFLSETAERADVVLPGASFLEKDGTFTNGERRIQRVHKALDPPGSAQPDWQILLQLMSATGLPQTFQAPAQIMDEIAQVAPQFAGVSYQRLDQVQNGLQWPVSAATTGSEPDQGGTSRLHTETFGTGRARFQCVQFEPSPSFAPGANGDFPLRLVTGRVLDHYNCGSMTRRTDNLRLQGGDFLDIHPDDAHARGLTAGMTADVTSDFGVAHATVRVTNEVPPGTVFMSFHFPGSHTNHVTTDVLDRIADCPEYKLTPVEVTLAEGVEPP